VTWSFSDGPPPNRTCPVSVASGSPVLIASAIWDARRGCPHGRRGRRQGSCGGVWPSAWPMQAAAAVLTDINRSQSADTNRSRHSLVVLDVDAAGGGDRPEPPTPRRRRGDGKSQGAARPGYRARPAGSGRHPRRRAPPGPQPVPQPFAPPTPQAFGIPAPAPSWSTSTAVPPPTARPCAPGGSYPMRQPLKIAHRASSGRAAALRSVPAAGGRPPGRLVGSCTALQARFRPESPGAGGPAAA
jgi:hypothetical protein